jgi:hypothetical protein
MQLNSNVATPSNPSQLLHLVSRTRRRDADFRRLESSISFAKSSYMAYRQMRLLKITIDCQRGSLHLFIIRLNLPDPLKGFYALPSRSSSPFNSSCFLFFSNRRLALRLPLHTQLIYYLHRFTTLKFIRKSKQFMTPLIPEIHTLHTFDFIK